MIEITKDKALIVPLWQEAFGDSVEEILFFLENARHAKCYAAFENGEAAAMLFLVDCRLNGAEGKYIYAACTAQKWRGSGCMTRLLAYCTETENLLCLIPGDDGMVKFYADRGFRQQAPINSLLFDETSDICEYLLEGFHLTTPCVLYFMR